MSPEFVAQFEMQKTQVVGSLTQLAANMRECAVYAEQFAQMINGIPWTGNPAAFPALANGQYMPVMPPMAMAHDDHGRKRKSRGGDELDGKRRQKKPRDPNAPKRPPSSYLLFQNDVRAELKAKNPQMRNNELLSAISKLWSEMPQQQKDEYEARNKAAKDKWVVEKEAYKAVQNGGAGAGLPVAAAVTPAVAAKPAVADAPSAESSDVESSNEDDEESSGSPESSDDEDDQPKEPPPKKSKKESAAAAKDGEKEKKHKKSKA